MQFKRQRFQQGCIQLEKRKTGPDVWLLRYRGTAPDGRRVLRYEIIGPVTKYRTESQARKASQALLLAVNAGCPSAGPVTMNAVIDRYMREEMPTRFSSACGYRSRLEAHIRPRWGDFYLHDIKPMAVEAWLREKPLSPKSRAHLKNQMRLLFSCAMRWELIELGENPMSLVRVPGSSKRLREPNILTIEQFHEVLTLIKEPYRTMCIVAACLGLRISEVLGLQWNDFDFDNRHVQIRRAVVRGRIGETKTETSRKSLPMAPELVEVLLAHRERLPGSVRFREWVFPSWRTGVVPHAYTQQRRWLLPAGKAVGIEGLGWHAFRHTYSSLLNEHGTDAAVQQRLLRHADVRTTLNIYTHTVPKRLRDAHEKIVSLLVPQARAN